MALPISGIGGIGGVAAPASTSVTPAVRNGNVDFADALMHAVGDARDAEKTAADASARFADGDPSVGIHEVVIAAEKANVTVHYATTLKNKLIDAYRELMNTPV
jgi:flagellar hook-basal body complex protein FliE